MKSRLFLEPSRLCGVALYFTFVAGIPEGGAAEPWKRHAIDPADSATGLAGADGVKTGDLNGDGLVDFVTGWEEGGKVRVCLHPGREKVGERWPAITVGTVRSPEDAVFADLDGDGRLDVVSACEGKERRLHVHWAPGAETEVTDESAWMTATFEQGSLVQSWMQILPRDLDGDGDPDLIAGSKGAGGSVTWLENPGGAKARDLTIWTIHRLADATWIMSIEVLKMEDGSELVYSDRKGEGSGIWTAPFLDESPWIGAPRRIAAAGEEVMFLEVADVDGDKREDLVAAIRPATIRVYLQPVKGDEVWTSPIEPAPVPQESFGSVKAVAFANIDEKGYSEYLITCENAKGALVGVLLADGKSNFVPITTGEGVKFDRIELIDLDKDGDLDLVTCEERDGLGVVWYENPAR